MCLAQVLMHTAVVDVAETGVDDEGLLVAAQPTVH
jgi:hypothetical protein